jgi:hypothetical protein
LLGGIILTKSILPCSKIDDIYDKLVIPKHHIFKDEVSTENVCMYVRIYGYMKKKRYVWLKKTNVASSRQRFTHYLVYIVVG